MCTKAQSTIVSLDSLLTRTYELIQYCRSRFDEAPMPAYLNRYPGHVEDDPTFCEKRDRLLDDIKQLLMRGKDGLRYPQFLSQMERAPRSIAPDASPVWKGMVRCRCWWDAKDYLQALADYLEGAKTRARSRRSRRIWAVAITLVGTCIAVVTNFATDFVPRFLSPYRWLAWPLLALLVMVSLLLIYYSN